jgi:hypothetical protein
MFVVDFSFGGRVFERVQQWQASVKVSLRESSGGTQTAPLDDYNLGLSAWKSPWSFPTGLSTHHQHSASDFFLRQAAQLNGNLDLTLEMGCQTLRGRNGLLETRRIITCASSAPRGRNGFLAVHRPSPASSKQTSEMLICAMRNCRSLTGISHPAKHCTVPQDKEPPVTGFIAAIMSSRNGF